MNLKEKSIPMKTNGFLESTSSFPFPSLCALLLPIPGVGGRIYHAAHYLKADYGERLLE
jgi:hypothetical protein